MKRHSSLFPPREDPAAQRAWNLAAARFPDFNRRLRAEVQISHAIESVLRSEPIRGTAVAVYLGSHPAESKALAIRTLAGNDAEWILALAEAEAAVTEIYARINGDGRNLREKEWAAFGV